jgi:hypothetical protein
LSTTKSTNSAASTNATNTNHSHIGAMEVMGNPCKNGVEQTPARSCKAPGLTWAGGSGTRPCSHVRTDGSHRQRVPENPGGWLATPLDGNGDCGVDPPLNQAARLMKNIPKKPNYASPSNSRTSMPPA